MDLKRGDRLKVTGLIWNCKGKHPEHTYRFRIDPVPFCHSWHGCFASWYKVPKVMQEKRASFAYPEYVRKKRSIRSLPDSWDDIQRGDIRTRKNWKNKKIKKQWMKAIIRQR
jgi:hypothetical protein